MNSEIEAKFLDINHDTVRQSLSDIGASLIAPMYTMQRIIFDFPDGRLARDKNAFMRVRQEYAKTTMTYKQFDDISIDGAKEVELVVDNFDEAIRFCSVLGLVAIASQESRREVWLYQGSEVVLDEWPWLKPYIEIESTSGSLVKSTAHSIGLDWKKAVFGDVMSAYRAEYPGTPKDFFLSHLDSVKFGDPKPKHLKY